MADQNDDAPQGAPQGDPALLPAHNDAPAPGPEQTPPTDGQAAATQVLDPAAQTPDQPKRTPWFQTRIDQLTREKWDERRERERLASENSVLQAALEAARRPPAPRGDDQLPPFPSPSATAGAPLTPADIDRLAEQKARDITRMTAFNEACNKAYDAGKTAFSDFDESLKTFQMLGGLRPDLLEVTTALPDGHKLLYHLGRNPDEAARILALAPIPMALALARLASQTDKPGPQVSSAPPPIRPVDGSARGQPDPETMSMDGWLAWREKQLARRRGSA